MYRLLTLSAVVLLYCSEASALSLDALSEGLAALKLEANTEAEEAEVIQKLYDAAVRFNAIHGSDAEKKKWEKTWEGRLKTAEKDDPIYDEETFSIRVLCTFCFDKREQLKDPEKIDDETLLFASRLFCRCKEKGFAIPGRIKAFLKNEMADKVVQFLDARGKG